MSPEPTLESAQYGPPISLELAKKVMAAAETEASANQWTVVVAIVDSGGNLVMLHKMDETQLGSITVAKAKAETAVSYMCPTKVWEERLASGGVELRGLTMGNVIAVQGGVPLIVGGKLIGSIGVSGMAPPQDTQVALAGVAALPG